MGFLIVFILMSFSTWGLQVKVIGSRAFRSEAIRERILNKVEDGSGELDHRKLDQLQFQILNLYRNQGFIDAQLRWIPQDKLLTCEITEGKQILVSHVSVVGAKNFSNEFLEQKIKEFIKSRPAESSDLVYDYEEVGAILNPKPKTYRKPGRVFFEQGELPFNKNLFLSAREFLENLYLDQGFLEVQIFGPKESEIHDKNWINLQFRIEEGPQTRVSRVIFEGQTPAIENQLIPVGAPLNPDKVDDFRNKIEEYFLNHGYPHAEIESRIHGSEVIYVVNSGDRIKIEKIDIVGNRKTRIDVIRKRIQIQAGDWYSLEKIAETRSQIFQTDLFSEVSIELEGDTLKIAVQERERNTFELGVGASLQDGPRITGTWQRRNLFESGISFRSRAQLNYPAIFYGLPVFYPPQVSQALKQQTSNYLAGRVIAGFLYPKILGVPFDLDAAIDLNAERTLKPAYVLNKTSLVTSFYSQVLKNWRLTPQIEAEYANFDCPTCNPSNQNLTVRLDNGTVKQATFRLLSLWDQRDSALTPRKGFAFEWDTDLGFGDANATPIAYLKVLGGWTSYVPLIRQLTWVFNTRAGAIFNLIPGAYVPLFKRFYLGGTNSVRGFSDDQIFPADATQIGLVSLGGNYMAFARNEIRFPISGELQGGIFVDVGELLQDIRNFNLSLMAVGTGFGIRYNTPIGPLMFDLGIKLFNGNHIDRSNFINLLGLHFSIGNAI